MEKIRREILAIRDEIRRLREGGGKEKESPADVLRQVRQILEVAEKIRGKSEIESLKEELRGIRDELGRWTGDIDEKKLRLRELELEKEIKKTEAEAYRSSAERIAAAIENISKHFGSGMGEILAGKAGRKQMIVVGDEVKAVCPQCAAEFSAPVGEEIKCPVCKHVLWRPSEGMKIVKEREEDRDGSE